MGADIDPIIHFLQHGEKVSPSARFDSLWYLQQYPDVAASGMNPLVHYLRYGQAEGRLPKQIYAQLWEQHLWAGLDPIMLPRLQTVLDGGSSSDSEVRYAALALARWHAWQEDWAKVRHLLCEFQDLDAPFPTHLGPVLMAIEALQHCGDANAAELLASRWLERRPLQADLCLAQANLCADAGDVATCLDWINRPWLAAGLSSLALRDACAGLHVDNLETNIPPQSRITEGPMVSVIVPAYNAETTIATALRSLFQQTWRMLEILVVDDASSDGTWSVLEDLARECPTDISIRVLRHPRNQGAYAARNTAMSEARGDLITCHDSDDWSHPQKLANQVRALLDSPDVVASVSHWVRVAPQMHFHRWRVEEGWIDRNVSSLMFRRRVFDELGYWDRVSIAADTEYYYRIFAAYGERAVREVLPGLPLTFGRADPDSLSQHSETHEVSQFAGLRKDYMVAAHRWHQLTAKRAGLYLSSNPSSRPFYAPQSICRGASKVVSSDPLDVLLQSGLLDELWYRYRYPDLLEIFFEPLQHYWEHGAVEGRDPGPGFSSSGYACRYGLSKKENPLLHYLTEGKRKGYSPHPVFDGKRARRAGENTVLLCAHQAGQQLYGAERCLIDLLQGLDALGMNVVVSLPGVGDRNYLALLREHAIAVAVMPYGWWIEGRPDCEETIAGFTALFDTYAVDQVYLNTLVLHEPALAAHRAGLPVVVHVHELPTTDVELCRVLNSDAEGVSRHLLSLADRLVANSRLVASYLRDAQSRIRDDAAAARQPIHVLPNTVAMEQLVDLAPSPFVSGAQGHLTVGMISSNLPKKGLNDFVAMARILAQRAPSVRCMLFGPRNQHIDSLFAGEGNVPTPANLSFEGYVAEPVDALAKLDVVVNLSHCQESFGRTVLEAMAAGRAVVCYDWGALPELVVSGETGFLSPFGELDQVAGLIARLTESIRTLAKMGLAGRQRAVEVYGRRGFMQALEHVCNELGQSSGDNK